jgi:hypothetical protein
VVVGFDFGIEEVAIVRCSLLVLLVPRVTYPLVKE